MTAPVVELRAIGKTFPGVRALHDVSLTIGSGEVLGLVGENGAGKSTLIKILGGVYPAGSYRGEVVVGGKRQAFRSTVDARRAGIAVVHQELALVPEMTVAENLLLGREPMRFGLVDGAQLETLARAQLRAVLGPKTESGGLAPTLGDDAGSIDLATPVGMLGVGVQQILEIARALADSARVIILDEPTAALADAEVTKLFALIRARRAAGASFVYISHRLDEIAALCDRVAVLRDGELVDILPPTADLVRPMTGDGFQLRHLEADPDQGSQAYAPQVAQVETVPVLEVRDLRVAHPGVSGRAVVDGLSFEIRAGEVVALAGAMGAGRTATLSALFGTARAGMRGEIRVDGKPVAIATPRDAIAAGLAYVPEDRKAMGLVLGLGVAENLALSALGRLSRFGMIDGPRAERSAMARVRELSIKIPALDAEVSTLSGGNQQKVVIGKWLELAPRVLLLDEPTRGVDVGAKAEIYALVEELTARGHAVLLASSDLPEVVRLADRVIVLREGRPAGTLEGAGITALAIMQLAVGTLAGVMAREAIDEARA